MSWSDWVVVGQKAVKVAVLKKAKSAIAKHANARLKVLGERRARADELARATREALGYGGKDHARLNAIVERFPRLEPIDAITSKTPITRPSTPFELTLDYDAKTAVPPFDDEYAVGNFEKQTKSDRNRGAFNLIAASGDVRGTNAAVWAATGVVLSLTSDRDANVQVRPLIAGRYQYHNQTAGISGYATSQGGIEIAVFGEAGPVAGPVRLTLFENRASGTEDHVHEDGLSCWPTIAITFDATANHPYVVLIGVWAECDNDSGIGAAQAYCQLIGGVNAIFVERVAGP
jgi:hypothetical protein